MFIQAEALPRLTTREFEDSDAEELVKVLCYDDPHDIPLPRTSSRQENVEFQVQFLVLCFDVRFDDWRTTSGKKPVCSS